MLAPAQPSLNGAQLAEAEDAFDRLGSGFLSLAIERLLTTYKPFVEVMPLGKVTEGFLADRAVYH
jgi:hypothetical protein